MGLMGMMGVGMGWTADNGHPRELLFFQQLLKIECCYNMFTERTWRMRLLQPYALGRASVAGRVSDGARQNGLNGHDWFNGHDGDRFGVDGR